MSNVTHAFVSYAHQDVIIADALEEQLTHLAKNGRGKSFLTCFLDTKSIPKGQKYEPIIRAGLKDADWLIVILEIKASIAASR